MTHQLVLDIPEEVFVLLVQKAQATGQTVETLANDWLAAAVHRAPAEPVSRSWIGAFESDVADAAERHHEYQE